MLKTGTVVDATIIAAPSSSKNNRGERDPQMHQTKKGKQWHFGMKAHIGVDAQSGLVHTVIGTAANVNDVTQATQLLHGQETDVFADAGYQGVDKRQEAQGLAVDWHIAMRPGKRAALELSNALAAKIEQLEKIKASIRAKVEHPFRLIKQQFGHAKCATAGWPRTRHDCR
jgi:IS5 family transposase